MNSSPGQKSMLNFLLLLLAVPATLAFPRAAVWRRDIESGQPTGHIQAGGAVASSSTPSEGWDIWQSSDEEEAEDDALLGSSSFNHSHLLQQPFFIPTAPDIYTPSTDPFYFDGSRETVEQGWPENGTLAAATEPSPNYDDCCNFSPGLVYENIHLFPILIILEFAVFIGSVYGVSVAVPDIYITILELLHIFSLLAIFAYSIVICVQCLLPPEQD